LEEGVEEVHADTCHEDLQGWKEIDDEVTTKLLHKEFGATLKAFNE
jgi:hypothetical protein